MRIYAFVEHYPNPYKAYYDAQFSDLLRKGHTLRVFAHGRFRRVIDDKVVREGLADRTDYFCGDEFRRLPRFAPKIAAALVRNPGARLRSGVRIGRHASAATHRVKDFARAMTLPLAAPDLCVVHSHATLALLPWLRSLYGGVPVALCYHGGRPPEAGALAAATARRAFASADVVFTGTAYARAEAVDAGCPPEVTQILPVGFDLDDYRPPEPRAYRPDGLLRLASAGRLSDGKGHRYALEAIRRLAAAGEPAPRYTIIGDGPLRPALERSVRAHGMDGHVTFTGTLAHRDMVAALGEVDALLLPSVPTPTWVETQGAVVQEALLMKAVAVVSRTGGVPESIPGAMRRFMAAPGDAGALAAAISRVRRLSELELRRLGREGRRWVADRYEIAVLNERMLATACAAAAGGGTRRPR